MSSVVRTPDEVLESLQKPELKSIDQLNLNLEDYLVAVVELRIVRSPLLKPQAALASKSY